MTASSSAAAAAIRRQTSKPRVAATWRDVGLHALSGTLIGANVLCLTAAVGASLAFGPRVAWLTDVPGMLLLSLCLVLWAGHAAAPGTSREWAFPDMLVAMVCLTLAGFWISPAQYLVAGLNRPLIDPLLATGDGWLGIHTPTLAAWTAAHPAVNTVLALAYISLLPQFLGAAPFLGLYLRQRRALWEYVWHFHVCASITLLAWTLFPAASAFQYYGFEAAFDESRFIAHFTGLRAGTLGWVALSDTEGLISMPSFHVAGALIATWAARSSRRSLAVLIPVNVLLIASTVLSGVHYAVDVLGAFVLFGVSLLSWRWLGQRLLPRHAGG